MSNFEQMNADDVEMVAEGMRALDKITEVSLHGSLMVSINERHVGYVFVSETETVFSQRSSS